MPEHDFILNARSVVELAVELSRSSMAYTSSGYGSDQGRNESVNSQFMDQAKVDWVSPDATVTNSASVCLKTNPDNADECLSWGIKGQAQVSKITDIDGTADHFTRIYGRETGKRASDGTHMVRPGFDSNIATDNRLKPNVIEKYTVIYDTKDAVYPYSCRSLDIPEDQVVAEVYRTYKSQYLALIVRRTASFQLNPEVHEFLI